MESSIYILIDAYQSWQYFTVYPYFSETRQFVQTLNSATQSFQLICESIVSALYLATIDAGCYVVLLITTWNCKKVFFGDFVFYPIYNCPGG